MNDIILSPNPSPNSIKPFFQEDSTFTLLNYLKSMPTRTIGQRTSVGQMSATNPGILEKIFRRLPKDFIRVSERIILYKGRTFTLDRLQMIGPTKDSIRSYWRCSRRRHNGCHASCSIVDSEIIFMKEHSGDFCIPEHLIGRIRDVLFSKGMGHMIDEILGGRIPIDNHIINFEEIENTRRMRIEERRGNFRGLYMRKARGFQNNNYLEYEQSSSDNNILDFKTMEELLAQCYQEYKESNINPISIDEFRSLYNQYAQAEDPSFQLPEPMQNSMTDVSNDTATNIAMCADDAQQEEKFMQTFSKKVSFKENGKVLQFLSCFTDFQLSVLYESSTWYIDIIDLASYSSDDFKHVIIILGKYKSVYMPCCYFFTTSKGYMAFTDMFTDLRTAGVKKFGDIKPKKIFVELKKVCGDVLRLVFGKKLELDLCFYHYKKRIEGYLEKQGYSIAGMQEAHRVASNVFIGLYHLDKKEIQNFYTDERYIEKKGVDIAYKSNYKCLFQSTKKHLDLLLGKSNIETESESIYTSSETMVANNICENYEKKFMEGLTNLRTKKLGYSECANMLRQEAAMYEEQCNKLDEGETILSTRLDGEESDSFKMSKEIFRLKTK